MTKRQWKRELFCAIMLTIVCIGTLLSPSARNAGAAFLIIPALTIHSWYKVIRWAPKS